MAIHPPFATAWLRQREAAADALAAVARAELRALDDETALTHTMALLSLPVGELDEARRAWSGLVEQQRLFLRARR